MLASCSLCLLASSDTDFAKASNDVPPGGDGLLGLGAGVVLCTGDGEEEGDACICPASCSSIDKFPFSFLGSADPGLDEASSPETPSVAFLEELGLAPGLVLGASGAEGDG